VSAEHRHVPNGDEPTYFLEKPENVRWLFRAFYALCALLVAADLVVHRHMVHPWERLPGFYALYGFVGIVVLVIVAKLLRRAVMRPEDYYDVD
jgi:hypothetical protein